MNNLKKTWTKDYTVVSNALVNAFGLHPMVRFMCIYLSAQADKFQFNNSILCQALSCSEATLRKYMQQAIEVGLIKRERIKVNGKFGYFSYTLVDPTTLQFLPPGKFSNAEKNQCGKSVRLNKEEKSNKEEIYNKGVIGTSENPTEPNPADEFDRLCAEGSKEKNSAKKEKPEDRVTPETARARAAMIRQLGGEPVTDPDPQPELSPEDVTEATMLEIQTEQGKRRLKFAMQSAGVSDADKINLFAAVYRCAQHQKELRGTVPRDLFGKLPGYLKTQQKIEKRQTQLNSNANRKQSTQNRRVVKDCPSQFDYSDDASWTA